MPSTARSAWTCEACRRRKVKCDSKDPCVHCVRRGEHCKWPEGVQRKHGAEPLQTSSDLHTRVERIETILEHSGLLRPQSVDTVSQHGTTDSQEEDVEIEALANAGGDHLQSEVHRHDDFDHHIIDVSSSRPRHGSRSTRHASAKLEAHRLLIRTLPAERRLCDDLLQSYLLNVEWIHHPLHVPQFQAEYDAFWRGYDESDLPDLQWLALLTIVLCLGSHFHPEQQSIKREEDLYTVSFELLLLSNHLAHHSITVIQTLILMGLWLNNRGLSNTHHAQLALAIKMAMNLGLSKVDASSEYTFNDDDDTFFLVRKQVQSQHCDKEREMKRRLWWSLVCQDYYTASSCNFTYTIHPKQCKTRLFLNLDDEGLLADGSTITTMETAPIDVLATCSSYQLVKIPFARVAKAMTDLYNADQLSYDAVLDLEKLLWRTYEDLPDFFKWKAHRNELIRPPTSQYVVREHVEWQRLFLGFTVHNRVLRLHRPFMAHGYTDPTKIHSRQATVESALACLALAEEGRSVGFPGLRWWVVLIHIFTSGVALCIDYHYLLRYQRQETVPIDLAQLTRSRRQHISRALRLLRPASKSSVAAARAIAVISSLVKQAEHSSESMHSPSTLMSGKRHLDHSPDVISPVQSSHLSDTLTINPYLSSNYTAEHNTFQPPNDDWLATMNVDEWTGPDWDQLFASLPNTDDFSPTGGMSADLYETINSFAYGFAPD